MDKLLIGIIIAAITGAVVFFAAVVSTMFGALAGWAVGWLFDETSYKVLNYIGVQGFEMWEIGAALGFVGSFFRSSSSSSSSN